MLRRKSTWRERLAERWSEGVAERARHGLERLHLPSVDRLHLPKLGRPHLPAIDGRSLPSLEALRELGRPRRRSDVRTLLLAGAAGALLAYLLDPAQGRRRRKVGRDRLFAGVRGIARRAGRGGRHVVSDVRGFSQRLQHEGRGEGEPRPNDETLAARVQSELFRDPDVPKGSINVNVERGIVVLRGELESVAQAYELERRALEVPGVLGVENLLHAGGLRAES
ncbi:MAG: BON domain-containing protein [Gemmatimonadota bacterium]